MTKTGVEEEGLAVCEMMEKVEGVEEGKMEKKAEEKVPEAKLGVLPGMPGSCLSQEAEPQSPTMDEHKPCPDGSTAEGHIKVTDRIAGQKKVFWKRQKAEAAGTEGGSRNTLAPFRLQDFMCFKISKHTVLLLLVLLAFPVNSNETSKQRKCAVCLEKDCANGVTRIWGNSSLSDKPVWPKANSPTGIQNCSMENLKPDAPCKMANGSLVQLADNPLQFEGPKIFNSQSLSCDKLNLPPSSTPSPGVAHVAPTSKASIHNTPTPEAPNDLGIIIGSVIGSIIFIGFIGFLIWNLYNCLRGLYRGRRQGNNGVPPHNAEHPNEITIEMQPLKEEVANGNVNGVHREDGSVGTAG